VPSKKPGFFVDTNVFIYYILLKNVLKEIKDLQPLYDKLKPSLDFLELYFENKEKVNLRTSFINFCEMPTLLVENLVMGRMYLKQIPFNYLGEYKKDFLKNPGFKEEVNRVIDEYYDFLKRQNIWFIYGITVSELYQFKEIDKLRLEFHLPLSGALIFAMAKDENLYFVTNDEHHFLGNKALKRAYGKNISIISPKRAIEIIKSIKSISQ